MIVGRTLAAVSRQTEIVSHLCPYGGVCTCKLDGSTRWTRCGNYDGIVRDKHGVKIICKAGHNQGENHAV